MPQWRALQTKPNLESIADASLRVLQIETFYPRRLVRPHRGLIMLERPYFRGYIFADLSDRHLHDAKRARGVHAIVGTLPIPELVILALKARADAKGVVSIPLERGKSYPVLRPGGLGQLIATVEEIDSKARARVLIRLLGIDVPARIKLSDLATEAVTHPA